MFFYLKSSMDGILNNGVILERDVQINPPSPYMLVERHSHQSRVKAYLHNLSLLFKQQDTVFFLRKKTGVAAEPQDFFDKRNDDDWATSQLHVVRGGPNSIEFQHVYVMCGDNSAIHVENTLWEIKNVTNLHVTPNEVTNVMVYDLWKEWAVDVCMRAPHHFTDQQLLDFMGRFNRFKRTRFPQLPNVTALQHVYNRNEFIVKVNADMLRYRPPAINPGDSELVVKRKLLSRHRQLQRAFPRGLWIEGSVADRVGWKVFPLSISLGMRKTYVKTQIEGDWWSDALESKYLHENPRPDPTQNIAFNPNPPNPPNVQQQTVLFARCYYMNEDLHMFVNYDQGEPVNIENSGWTQQPPNPQPQFFTRSLEKILPRVRQAIPLRYAIRDVAREERQLDENDAYEQLIALYGRKSPGLVQHAGLMGTQFHNGITRVLMHMDQQYAATCGILSMNCIRQFPLNANIDPESKRLQRAKDALMIRPFPPLAGMVIIMLTAVRSHVLSIPNVTNYEVVFTEFPVWFPYILKADRGSRGKVYETAVDAVVCYEGPPASDGNSPDRSRRFGMVEFKSIYGEKVTDKKLPMKEHLVQAVLQAFMLQESAFIKVDRLFLVYVSRNARAGVFDIPFYPESIPWQRQCIIAWMGQFARSASHYYMDRCLFAPLLAVLTDLRDAQANPQAPTTVDTALRRALFQPYAPVRQTVQPAGLPATLHGSNVITHGNNNDWLAVDSPQQSLDRLYFERRDDPQVPTSIRVQQAYTEAGAGTTANMLKQMAISGQREYPPNETPAHRQARNDLRGSIHAFINGLNHLDTVNPKRLHDELNARMGQPKHVEFNREYNINAGAAMPAENTQDRRKLNVKIIARAVQRELNRRFMRAYHATPQETQVIMHCNQKGLMSIQALTAMQDIFNLTGRNSLKTWVNDSILGARV